MRKILIILICFFANYFANPYNANAQWHQTALTYAGIIHTITIGDTGIFVGSEAGVLLSTDSGSSWKLMNNGLRTVDVLSLAISGTYIYAGTVGGGVFLSTNNGNSWTAANNGITTSLVYTLAISGTNIFAGTDNGLFLSTDSGTFWTSVLATTHIRSIVINDTSIFAGTTNGVFLSTNNGNSWTPMNNGLTNTEVYCLAITGTTIFAGTYFGGVFLSTNNGKNWTAVNNGLTNSDILSLAISGTNVFAGSYNGGVFISTNNGNNWTAMNNGLTDTIVWSLAVSSANIFAGTYSEGVWMTSLSEILAVENINADNNGFRICPNPLTSSSVLQFNTEVKNAEVVIYDMLGKERMRKEFIGKRMKIEKGSLESGVYFVSVHVNERQYMQKIVVE